jgi:uncharacterized protein GlcG (DUF336 family)
MAARAAVSPASTVSCFAGGSPCCAEVVAMPKANYRTGSRETLLQKACSDQNYRVSVAVVGVDGLIKVQLRGDGVGPHSLDSSGQKAYTAATFKRSTAEVEKGFRDRPERGLERLPNMLFVGGGLSIKAGEEVVGGIGVAGAPGGEATKLAQRQDSTPLRTSHRNDSRACVSTA